MPFGQYVHGEVFFDTNANGTPEAGEEAVASINPNTFPTGYNPALVGPVGAALKARPSLAGQLYVEVIGRIVDQNTPV